MTRQPASSGRRSPGALRGARALRGRLRLAGILVRDLAFLLPRHPRLAVRIARAEAGRSRGPALLPSLEAAIRVRPRPMLLRRRAEILESIGEQTAAMAAWRAAAAAGVPEGSQRARRLEGLLIETDPGWLPSLPGDPEPLAPVHRRRILHIAKSSAPERWSGFTIRTWHNLRAQREAGLEPIVLTEIGWPRVAGVAEGAERAEGAQGAEVQPVVVFDGIEHRRLDRGPEYRALDTPADIRSRDNVADMAGVVRELRPAILHAHSGYRGGDHALMALALRERFAIPVVYEVRGLFEAVWSTDPELAARSEQYARRLAQETRILREVDGVIAISGALADELASRGIPRERITVVPNGIDAAALGEPARDPGLRRSLGLEDRFVVGYLGNLDHWREGIEVLISALRELRDRGRREVAVLVVGDGARREALEAHARRLGVADGVRFTGRVPHEEVAQYYVQMDVFANVRLEERAARFITPLKPYEAMALGVPVLVSDLPALREIVDPPLRGTVAPVGDPAALASAIEALADDPEGRRRVAAAARAWVREERTWASNGPRYRAAYEAILGPLD